MRKNYVLGLVVAFVFVMAFAVVNSGLFVLYMYSIISEDYMALLFSVDMGVLLMMCNAFYEDVKNEIE